jgi:5'-nucleotidase
MLVNVNLPPSPRGIRWTHQSVRAYKGSVVEGQDPFGRKHYWFAPLPYTDPEEGSDRWAVENDLVALTPLRMDVTDKDALMHQKVDQCEALSAD